jgi:hypothetical protein
MSTIPVGNGCMASAWYEYITDTLDTFMDGTGLSMLDTDGAYSGEQCSSTEHEHHHNKEDNVYMQTRFQGIFYNKMREKGVYLSGANNYFYQGSQASCLPPLHHVVVCIMITPHCPNLTCYHPVCACVCVRACVRACFAFACFSAGAGHGYGLQRAAVFSSSMARFDHIPTGHVR